VIVDEIAAQDFIDRHTLAEAPPLTPEIVLQLATEITPIWQASEDELAKAEVPPPFWAFAWAGGQALARHILDHPELVRGKPVLDFGSGSGLVAIAAALAGAQPVRAAEIDAIACVAIARNALRNGVAVETVAEDVIDRDPEAAVVLVGDMCYERPLAERLVRWLRREAAKGVLVLLGDPGRTYRPTEGLEEVARYAVPTSLELEDKTMREGIVWRLLS
jgi:predicted nicotinamide N-methyase